MAAKCPICYRVFQKKADIIQHAEDKHADQLPKDMSTAQYIYMLNHDGRKNGICRYCGKETPWNEKTGKPYQLCGSPECKEKNKKIAEERMLRVYGKTNLLSDPTQQEKMLANRSISGTYIWSDGKHKFIYTGTYEKFAIEWLDKVMDLDPDTIQMPGPILPYDYNGETHYWITDMYLTEFNLIIEIKDGMENKHPGFEENRNREAVKDKLMLHQKEFNYIKLTHKNMMQLVKTLTDIRLHNILEDSNKEEPIVSINESIAFVNDKKEKVPKVCPKCGSKVGVFLRGEPVFLCTNKKCNKFFGVVQFDSNNESAGEPDVKKEKPLGKKRVVIEDNIKKVKFFPNEASGHKKEHDELVKTIETKPNQVWCLSDIHIGRTERESGIPENEFYDTLIKKINDLIDINDTILFLGDIVTSTDKQFSIDKTKKLLNDIHCKNVSLILGNNDNLTVKELYDCGYVYITDRLITDHYLFSHCPEPVTISKYNIHGHIHGAPHLYNMSALNHIDVYYKPTDGCRVMTLKDYVNLYAQGGYKYMVMVSHDYKK